MFENMKVNWRRSLGAAAIAVAIAQFCATGVAQAQTLQRFQAPATKQMISNPFGTLKHVRAGVLDVAYADLGPANGPVVILLHGWPYSIYSYAEVAPALAAKGYRVLVPYARGFGGTEFLSAKTPRDAEPAALAVDLIDFMDALHVKYAELAGFDWGARTADIVAALWPQRVTALVSVSGYLIGSQASGMQPLPPNAEYTWWYQYYFAIKRGALGYTQYTDQFANLIWKLASPKWHFSNATFEQSVAALHNPDQVTITISNYRWRLGLVEGLPKFASIEAKLAKFPSINVPTITMEGDANGAPHPPAEAYRKHFTGKYEYRLIRGAGHNLPQEAPQAFVQAVLDAAKP